MRYFLFFCRLLVGSLFIVSGLIKANDPLGFSFKLEEYFAEDALNMTFWSPYALALAILACTAEIVLGFAVLFGGRMKLATASLVALTIFFGWLTAFTGRCNDRQLTDDPMTYTVVVNGVEETREKHCVTDCGCFGDAMKGSVGRSLTPWESFTKDLVLFIFIVPITIASWRKPGIQWNTDAEDRVLLPGGLVLVAFFSWVFTWWGPLWFTGIGFALYLLIKRAMSGVKAEWATAAMATVLTLGFIAWCYNHLPVRDYRPYATGNDLLAMTRDARPPKNNIFLIYKNSVTGEQKEFTEQNYPWQDSTWVYVDRRLEEVDPGKPSQIQDFRLVDRDGNDQTPGILEEAGPVLLLITRSLSDASTDCIPAIKALTDEANKNGWYCFGATNSSFEEADQFKFDHQLMIDFLQCDETTLKTVNRSNPGMMMLQGGKVLGQWHCNDIPTFEEAKALVKEPEP